MAFVENRDDVDDPRLAVKFVRDRIAVLNAEGKHIPKELILIQNRFIEECVYASQGR